MKNMCFLIITLIAYSLLECSCTTVSSKHADDSISINSDSVQNTLALYKDTADMERYQTFDECEMCGKGEASNHPFVYVKECHDSIFVLSSSTKDSVRLYVRLNNDLWYSHMEYDMWKKKDYLPTKDELSKTARTYDRYFFNDTIMEIETDYIKEKPYRQLFIKYKSLLFHIRIIDNISYSSISDLRRIVKKLIVSNDKRVNKYVLKENENRYVYEGEKNGDKLSYERKAYGKWGMQPGLTETSLYYGIDNREYSDNLESYQQTHSDDIYETADEVPSYFGGTQQFYDYIENSRNASLILNDNKPNRVILEVVVEKDGSITNARVVKSIDSLHDNDALNIVRNMPKWTPAKLNGNVIRFKMLIPISYSVKSVR